jgi:hemerythrin-like domain-containing protein
VVQVPTREKVREWIAARVAADAQMRAAAQRRTARPAPPADPESSHDATVVLTRQHNQVRALLRELRALPGHRDGGSEQDLSKRRSIVDMITARLSQHEAAEEEHLWPAVRAVLPDGSQWADGALAQEQEGIQTLTALGKLDPGTDDFDDHVERLVSQLRRHVAYEDRVFLLLRGAMPDGDREQLGRRLEAAAEATQ